MRELGVQMEPEPEWNGPDPLIEMARKARRMVPASKVDEAVAAERARIEWLLVEAYHKNPSAVAFVCDVAIDRSGAMLGRIRDRAKVYREDTDAHD